ncbi:MAG: hypothetical protein DSY37_00650 [Hyperthermus sp.]|nr:MAG: hypothetical protein DSY37_00650 [Hyperthermus sp.]
MSMQITVKYETVYQALKPLTGLKLRGSILGLPTSKLPLMKIYDRFFKQGEIGCEEYRGVRVCSVKIDDATVIVCHFGLEEPDDFCIVVEGDNAWERIVNAANALSRAMNASYTLTLASLIHAIQGIIHGEEERVEEIQSPDQIIEELITWLPEYIAITD